MERKLGNPLSNQQMHEFGIKILLEVLVKEGFQIIRFTKSFNENPNIVVKKDNKTYYIASRTSEVHSMPILDDKTKNIVINLSRFNKCIAAFASIGIGAADHIRFENKELLENDAFYANYEGLEILADFSKSLN